MTLLYFIFNSLVFEVMDMCPTAHYILAVDEGNNTQKEIVQVKMINCLLINFFT